MKIQTRKRVNEGLIYSNRNSRISKKKGWKDHSQEKIIVDNFLIVTVVFRLKTFKMPDERKQSHLYVCISLKLKNIKKKDKILQVNFLLVSVSPLQL